MGARKLLWRALEFATSHPRGLVPWVLMFAAYWALGGSPDRFLKTYPARWNLYIAFSLLHLVLWAWASAVTLLLLRSAEEAKPLRWGEAVSWVLERTPALLGLGLIAFVLAGLPMALLEARSREVTGGVAIALFLFLLWAVFWGARLFFAPVAIVWDGTPLTQALSLAWRISRPTFWPLARFFFLLVLIGLLFELLGRIPGARAFFGAFEYGLIGFLQTAGAGWGYLELRRQGLVPPPEPPAGPQGS